MSERFDLVVIGAGSAGLTAVDFAAKLGVKVALVEKGKVGGDCTWSGCIPSKALLQAAKVAQTTRNAARFGVMTPPPQVDMRGVRDYVREAIAAVYQHETPEILQAAGIDMVLGPAQFVSEQSIQVGERLIRSKKFIVATGARPFTPPIPGLADVPYLTYEQIFDQDWLPERMLVLGAGSTGVELAQAYGRLGASVTLFDKALLPGGDPAIAAVMEPLLAAENVRFVAGLASAVSYKARKFTVTVNGEDHQGDLLLVATGRQPNISGLGLDKAGVRHSELGIQVDDGLHTSARHIYAAGDVVQGSYQFTHFAGWQGFQAVRNALLPGSSPGFSEDVPRVIFTDPEIAQVGLTEAAAKEQYGEAVQITREEMKRVDRAVTDDVRAGFVKMVHMKNGRLVGATVVAPRAGELITEFTLALKHGLKIRDLAEVFHAYPSYAMGVQLPAAAAATDQVLTGTIGKVLRKLAGR